MTELPSQKSAAERALDLAVYVPLGLALSLAEAVPDMARKGRPAWAPRWSWPAPSGSWPCSMGTASSGTRPPRGQ